MECATFGEASFGAADLGDARRVQRLVQVADQLVLHPQESSPDKFHEPADLKVLDYSGLPEIEDLSQVGDGHKRGYDG